jgi:hypothetical protein
MLIFKDQQTITINKDTSNQPIEVSNCDHLIVEFFNSNYNITINNCKNVKISNSKVNNITVNKCNDLDIEFSNFNSIVITNTVYSNINNNEISNGVNGVVFNPPNNDSCVVRKNTIKSMSGHGILLTCIKKALIEENIITKCGISCVYAIALSDTLYIGDVDIINNSLNSSNLIIAPIWIGKSSDNSKLSIDPNYKIVGNTISQINSFSGIQIEIGNPINAGIDSILIENNYISATANHTIFVQSGLNSRVKRLSILKNKFLEFTATNTTFLLRNCDNLVVKNNELKPNWSINQTNNGAIDIQSGSVSWIWEYKKLKETNKFIDLKLFDYASQVDIELINTIKQEKTLLELAQTNY